MSKLNDNLVNSEKDKPTTMSKLNDNLVNSEKVNKQKQ